MASVFDAINWCAARGYTDWTALSIDQKTASLLQAQDYILANYQLRVTLSSGEQTRLDTATYLLAREFAARQPTLLQSAPVKELKEQVGSLITDTTYAAAPTDAYPQVSGLLAPLLVSASRPSAWNDRLVVLCRPPVPAPVSDPVSSAGALDGSQPQNGVWIAACI